LPDGAVFAVHQTAGGYLWLGTQCCLVRFDGERFVQFASGERGLGQAAFARDLAEDVLGRIWAGFAGGVGHDEGSRFAWFDERSGLSHPFVYALYREQDTLWIGTGGAGVWKLQGDKIELHPSYAANKQLPGQINDLTLDSGALWAATDAGLVSLQGAGRVYTVADGLPADVVTRVLSGPERQLYVGTRSGLAVRDAKGIFHADTRLGARSVTALARDEAQTLWVGAPQGLYRETDAGFEAMPGEPLSVLGLATDREGSLWVGTADGLVRYRDGAFVTTGRAEGLPDERIFNVLPRQAGGLWMLDASGAVWIIDHGKRTAVTAAGTVAGEGMLGLAETADGSLWIASNDLIRLKDGVTTSLSHEGGVFSVLERDGSGLLVAQTTSDGQSSLSRLESGTFSPIMVGAPLLHVQRLHRDGAGRLWISTGGSGLVRQSGQDTKVFGVREGLPSDVVYGLTEAADGTLWIATRTGLASITNDVVTSYAKLAGAPTRSPMHVQLDARGDLWVTANDGIYRLSVAELKRGAPLEPDIYTTRDGLRSSEISWRCAGQAQLDGKLFYATARGLAEVEPATLDRRSTPPLASIESVSLNERPVALGAGLLDIKNRRDSIAIRFSGPDLAGHGRVEFRHQLVGYESAWSAGSTARVVHYGNLPAGEYTFRVSARRSGEPWADSIESLRLRVAANWYETLGARVALFLAALAFGYAFYRLKLSRLRESERQLTLRVAQRTQQLEQQMSERDAAEKLARELAEDLELRVRERTVELELANLAARKSEGRYALAVRGAEDGLWDWDVAVGFMYWSPRFKQMLGYQDNELAASIDAWFSRVHPEDLESLRDALSLTPTHSGQIRVEYRMRDKNDDYQWFLCRGVVVFDEQRNATRAAGSQTDISARKSAEAAQQLSATLDPLTGLPNQSLFADRLEQAILQARRNGRPFALLFVDIDHFKAINDELGRAAGDELLVEMGKRLRSTARGVDTVARIGSDEFALLLSELPDAAGATQFAERVQRVMAEPFDLSGRKVEVAASVGIKLSSTDHQTWEQFLRDADMALNRAKEAGSRHHVFEPELRRQADERLRVEAGLKRALSQGEFVLFYQPLVSLMTNAVLGVEALVRWQDPERGLIGPNQFIGIAEACGLMLPLSDWVLSTACAQAKLWQDELEAPVRIAINLPPVLLNEPGLAKKISGELTRHGVRPAALGIEIVESSVLETQASVIENLNELRAMGIQIAIDDFGTGYSSFSYLKQLPIHYLKIDRSFTQKIPHDPTDTAICRALLAMAAQLKLMAVVEGVETQAQADYLKLNGCAVAQGYFFSRPLPADECTRFLKQNQTKLRGQIAFSPTDPALSAQRPN